MLGIFSIVFFGILGTSFGLQSYGEDYGHHIYASGNCPPGYSQELLNCGEPMQNVDPSQDLAEACSTAETAFDCMEDLMERCADQPDISLMREMVNVDQMRDIMRSECSGQPLPKLNGTSVNCPPGHTDEILACVEPIQGLGQVTPQNIEEGCRVAVDGLDCLRPILTACAGEPDVQAITRMLNIDNVRSMVDEQCSAIGAGGNNNGCPSGYSQDLLDCVEPMQTVQSSQDLEEVCRVADTGFECVEEIMERCSNQPDISQMTEIVNVDQIRDVVRSQCEGEPLPRGNGTSVNCPSGYSNEIMACVRPMQHLQSITPQNIEEGCRTALNGLDCLGPILTNCAGEPDVQAMTRMLNVENVRSMVETQCSSFGIGGNCPSSYNQDLADCVEPLQQTHFSQDLTEVCRITETSFDCMEDILERCSNQPDIAEMMQLVDIDSVRETVRSQCAREPLPGGNGTSVNCPPGYAEEILQCVRPMQGLGPVTEHNIAEACSASLMGIDCLSPILANCAGEPDVQAMASAMNIDNIRSMVEDQCSAIGTATGEPLPTGNGISGAGEPLPVGNGTSVNCPTGYAEEILQCVGPMQGLGPVTQHNIAEACSASLMGIDCLSPILANCAGEPDVQAMASAMNIDNIRSMVEDQCSAIGIGGAVNQSNTGTCPSGYLSTMRNCVEPMMGIETLAEENIELACSVADDGFGCLDNIIAVCGDKPEVQELTRVLNIGEMRPLLGTVCTGEPLPTGNGTSVNCPPGYSNEIMECVRPMQHLESVTPQNKEESCRTALTGFDCLSPILTSCAGEPDVQAMTRMLNVENLRSMVEEQCSSFSTGTCPSGYLSTMRNCVEPMMGIETLAEENIELACSIAADGFGCLDNVITDCGDKPEVQELTNMLNMDEMRLLVGAGCETLIQATVSPVQTGNTCNVLNPSQELQRCSEMMSLFHETSKDMGTRCQKLYGGFECFLDLISLCPEDPAVAYFTSMINIEEAQQTMSTYC